MTDLTDEEQQLVDYARERILENAKDRWENGLYDVIYAFALSESGEIYKGKPFESNQGQFSFCAERHAINQMQYEETEESELKAILVAGPVPDKGNVGTMPCGACRHAINEFGGGNTEVIVSNFIREGDGEWTVFPDIKKFNISELYPEAYEPVEWD